MNWKKLLKILIPLLIFILIFSNNLFFINLDAIGIKPIQALAVSVLMCIFWFSEAIPIHYTACIPIIVFPFLKLFGNTFYLNITKTFLAYLDPYIFLFAGGMAIATSMQKWDLHRRIALNVMNILGTQPRKIILGMLASTAFVSMWISNTATATMMLPIGLSVIHLYESRAGVKLNYFGAAIMLAIAYGANIGGIGTKIGTAPNSMFAGFMENIGQPISFLEFMLVGIPFVFIMIPIAWLVLLRVAKKDFKTIDENLQHETANIFLTQELDKIRLVQKEEKIITLVFSITTLLWICAKPITDLISEIANSKIQSSYIEGLISVLAAIMLMVIKVKSNRLLDFKLLKDIPWNSLLLLGGSFAMALGIQQSGLSNYIGEQLKVVQLLSPIKQIISVSFISVIMTAFASNVATMGILLNILGGVVPQNLLKPILFTATMGCSCDFALPAGTPPNAIVFGSGYLRINQMVKSGLVLDFISAIVIIIWCYLIFL